MMFGSVSEQVATLQHKIRCKTCASRQNVRFLVIELAKIVSLRTLPIYFIWPKTMFGSVSEHIAPLIDEIQGKTCVSGQNAQFRGIELAEKVSPRTHPIYSIGPKTMFGSVSEHYATLLQENQCKTCVSVQNVQFRGTEPAKKVSLRTHPIYSIRLKTMFGSVSEQVGILLHKIRCKTCSLG